MPRPTEDRVAIRPVFPVHVLFSGVKNNIRPDFFEFGQSPGFWTKYRYSLLIQCFYDVSDV